VFIEVIGFRSLVCVVCVFSLCSRRLGSSARLIALQLIYFGLRHNCLHCNFSLIVWSNDALR